MVPGRTARSGSVSIHAPARGATPHPADRRGVARFNPRSRAGSDTLVRVVDGDTVRFNPRSRAGSDERQRPEAVGVAVSIHAPARGATRRCILFGHRQHVSIHAPARGATRYSHPLEGIELFQSTLPRGERRTLVVTWPAFTRFQSTLPRGERLRRHWGSGACKGFNPRSRAARIRFNPRSRAGSDFTCMVNVTGSTRFNPRSRAGSDRLRPDHPRAE